MEASGVASTRIEPDVGVYMPSSNFTNASLKQANFSVIARHGARGLDEVI